jgi:hypothetical protein
LESPQGKLLGYIIIECGIEANPNQISVVTEMGLIKDVQQLMGCLTALNQFMFRHGEHKLPQYKLMKKSDSFHWMEEVQNVLDELKMLITKSLVVAPPEPCETLLYVEATT